MGAANRFFKLAMSEKYCFRLTGFSMYGTQTIFVDDTEMRFDEVLTHGLSIIGDEMNIIRLIISFGDEAFAPLCTITTDGVFFS